jgi:hypothetical protein
LAAASAELGAPMVVGSIDVVGERFRNTAFLINAQGLAGR